MSLADDIIDRQRLRKKLGFWRLVALLTVIAVFIAGTWSVMGDRGGAGFKSSDHIAHVTIAGTITASTELLERLEAIAENDNVKALILTVDSPGGTTVGGEAIYEVVRKIADNKPVVAQVNTLAASAGYMIASATDHIIARQTSIVGSIGVIFQYPKIDGLLETLGVEMRAIKSTPLKAEPSFFGETPPGAEAMIRAMILDSFDWFKDIVAERRNFDSATITRLADGSVFTGRQALENGLIDQLGGYQAAVEWTQDQDGVDDGLEVIEWEKPQEPLSLLTRSGFIRAIVEMTGLGTLLPNMPKTLEDRVFLDGLLSVWHAENN